MPTVHVIGAGVSGLACATRVALSDCDVVVYEAAGHAGGRARSFHDESLGCVIDNGSHLLLGANRATRAYLSDIDAGESLHEIQPAVFPFLDLPSGHRWRVRPSGGLLPFWLLSGERRVPGASAADHLRQCYRLYRAEKQATVADCVGEQSVLFAALWQPLCRAALNTDAREASATLLWSVVRDTFLKGETACRPMIFRHGLSAALVTPALRLLEARGASVRFLSRLRGIRWADHRVTSLYFPEGMLRIARDDAVVLAVPPDAGAEIWPEMRGPIEYRPIINAHFRLEAPASLPWQMPFLGILGAEAHWLFVRDNILSVTISTASAIADRPNWELANHLWTEVARVLDRPVGRLPPWRIIKERRATFAQTPAQVARRAPTETSLRNMFIAGDWTDTGLPATLESSVRSGFHAAQCALQAIAGAATDDPD